MSALASYLLKFKAVKESIYPHNKGVSSTIFLAVSRKISFSPFKGEVNETPPVAKKRR
jgi:hypothetical protein